MVRDRLLGRSPADGALVEWLHEQLSDGDRRASGEDAADETSAPSENDRTVADGGNPTSWDGDDPISFDDGDDDDGQSLLEAVTAASESAGTEIDLEAELRDAASTDEDDPTPEALLDESTRGASRRAESATASADGDAETDLTWSEAVDELIEREADGDVDGADGGTGADRAADRPAASGEQDRSEREDRSAHSDQNSRVEPTGTDEEQDSSEAESGVEDGAEGSAEGDAGASVGKAELLAAALRDDVRSRTDDSPERDGQEDEVDELRTAETGESDDATETESSTSADTESETTSTGQSDPTSTGQSDTLSSGRSGSQSTGPPDSSSTDEPDSAAAGQSDTPSTDESKSVRNGETTDPETAALRDRIDDIESEHRHVSTSVSSLETELDELRGDVDGIRSDLGTLVDLVKQTAHTRGGAAAASGTDATASETDAPTPAATGEPTADHSEPAKEVTETEPDQTRDAANEQETAAQQTTPATEQDENDPPTATSPASDGADKATTEGAEDATDDAELLSEADDSTPEADEHVNDVDGSGIEGGDSRPESEVSALEAGDSTSREDDTTALDAEQSVGTAERDAAESSEPNDDPPLDETLGEERTSHSGERRAVADPRSDAVSNRLLNYRKQFGSDDAAASQASEESRGAGGEADELPAADSFEFQKLLVPADGDGEPELVGDSEFAGVDLEQPYLESLPNGYAAEALVIEWLDGVVSQSDQETAVQALGYYQSIGWIGGSVRERLVGYLSGLGEIDEDELPDAPPAALDLSDHRRSLEYVTHLATGEVSDDGI